LIAIAQFHIQITVKQSLGQPMLFSRICRPVQF